MLVAAVAGMALCVFYDLMRIIRLISPPGKISAFLQDILWFAVASVMTYLICLAECKGEVRFYIIFGEICGFALFRVIVSRWIMRVARPTVKAGKRLVRRMKRAILRLVRPIKGYISKKIVKIRSQKPKKEKKHLRLPIPLLYNRKKKNVLSQRDTEYYL